MFNINTRNKSCLYNIIKFPWSFCQGKTSKIYKNLYSLKQFIPPCICQIITQIMSKDYRSIKTLIREYKLYKLHCLLFLFFIQACQWDPRDRTGAGSNAGNITNFTRNCAGQSVIFSRDSKETFSLIFVSHKKRYIRKTSNSQKQHLRMFSLKT